jgi:hypothetical protein
LLPWASILCEPTVGGQLKLWLPGGTAVVVSFREPCTVGSKSCSVASLDGFALLPLRVPYVPLPLPGGVATPMQSPRRDTACGRNSCFALPGALAFFPEAACAVEFFCCAVIPLRCERQERQRAHGREERTASSNGNRILLVDLEDAMGKRSS